MPSLLNSSALVVCASLILAVVLPTPAMHPRRVGRACLGLMIACFSTFATACTLIGLSMARVLPGTTVFVPAVAVLGLSIVLSMVMFWMSLAPEGAEPQPEADESDGDEGGGGGGGLRPEDDPPRHPGPSDGICWDAFDRERQAWEAVRPERDRVLAGV